MGISLSDLRIRTGNAQSRDTALFKDIGSRDGYAGSIGTKHDGYAVAYQLGSC